ncbi:PREDICTED: uncharacterized protein DKFZp434B061-like [Bison bison bison]|uniref:Uncharacterized protein DKFZp434B061-like n=1 Tax=Bison bison bison TaxID=43346 RepID=A0A6P3IHM2_BISBB|nr:PREDICTED: uncharacterized protein DKFZp434B061-like [Bison bison bison]
MEQGDGFTRRETILTTRTRAPRRHSGPKLSRARRGSKREASIRNKPRRPLPPRLLRGTLAGLRAQQQILPSRQAALQECFHQEGSPRRLQGTPTPRSASTSQPRLQHPGGRAGSAHKAPLPHPHSADTHTTHTHPATRGKPEGENPAFHAVRLRRGAAKRLGAPPAQGADGVPQRSPGLRAELAAGGSHEGRNPRASPTGGPPQAGLPPPPRPSKKRKQ